MADVTITGLPNAATLTGAERVPMDQSGATVDAPASAIAALATKATVGLGNADNTSDANKPISTAAQTALDGKAPAGPIGSSGLTMTAGILGRESGTGAPQVLALGSDLAIVGGALVVTGGGGGGGYPSLSMPVGFSVSGSGTASLGVTFATGYSLPLDTSQANWNTAFSERLRWDGSSTGLSAATGRASLGLAAVASSGAYGDLSGRPTLGTAAATDASTYATAAQGTKADTAVQPAALTAKADLVGGVVPTSQIPAIALVQYLGSVANQSAMLALRGEGGDWCIRSDSSTKWVIVANNGATLSDWIQLPNGISPVSSINGQTGAVTLGTGDLSESGGNLFFTAVRAIGSALTGFTAGAGTVAATDSILQALQKVVGNVAEMALAGVITGSGLTIGTGKIAGRFTAGTGAIEELTPTGGLSIQSGNLVVTDVYKVSVGDESTVITNGANKVRFKADFAGTLVAVRAGVNIAPTGSTLIIDINKNGVSMLGTKLSIDATETTSTTATNAATITTTSIADEDEISIDIDQPGATVAGAGLKVSLFVRRA
jgi:hypothetical protein